MSDANKLAAASKVYKILCSAIDQQGWKYGKEEDKLMVHFGVSGDNDLLVRFVIRVEPDRQLIRLLSPMPFKMDEDKRLEGAVAACIATYKMVDGSFDYDPSDGSIIFRMTASFRDSDIGVGLLQYMINCSFAMVDNYNDKFLAINKGELSIGDFIKQET